MSEYLKIADVVKDLRAQIIYQHVKDAGYPGIVVLSCGNAALWLRRYMQSLDRYTPGAIPPVVEIGNKGPLNAQQWLSPAEVHSFFPTYFDATSGHLPFPLMIKLAHALRATLTNLGRDTVHLVPTGSGETIICLRMAFPHHIFVAQYNNNDPATTYDPDNPLNAVVAALFPVTIISERKKE